ncbi:GNAT family N-acetyltransferase [Marinomonas ostreistagni]|uniref:GNAT family N-acetyltransferase n=1 Tax=Marinomonas ostreistagni TaxID=359209 RepID=UPI00194F01AF|nr:GNAT family N-acetyltransferase [Marinomonas ostreistagni]MBM6551492.1 GNAT family N-acetyltransferase [Marinomonas ostreistagni]
MFDKLTFKRRKAMDHAPDDAPLEEPISVEQASAQYAEKYDEQGFWAKCRRYAGAIGRSGLEKAFTLYYATEHKNCTLAHKTAIYGALGYLLTPIDAIPDLTPVLGYTDDIGLIGTALLAVNSCIDDGVKHQAKDRVGRLLGEGALDGIRHAQTEDLDAVVGTWLTAMVAAHSTITADHWALKVTPMRHALSADADIYVYEKFGQVVGFYALAEQKILGLCVLPEQQDQGIGAQLIAHLKAHHTPVTSELFQINEKGVEFMLRHGFKVAQEIQEAEYNQAKYVLTLAS